MNTVTLTTANAAQKKAISAANFLTSNSGDVPTFKTAAAIADALQFATVAAGAVDAEASRLRGGVKAMALVACLVASKTVDVDGKALDSWGAVKGWLEGRGISLGATEAAHNVAMSEIGRVFKGTQFAPAIPDPATIAQEAFATVREGLAKHGGSFQAWRDAMPKTAKAGRKAGKGAGKAHKGKAVKAMTERDAVAALRAMVKTVGVFATRNPQGEAADNLREMAKTIADMVAKLPAKEGKAKRQRKAA